MAEPHSLSGWPPSPLDNWTPPTPEEVEMKLQELLTTESSQAEAHQEYCYLMSDADDDTYDKAQRFKAYIKYQETQAEKLEDKLFAEEQRTSEHGYREKNLEQWLNHLHEELCRKLGPAYIHSPLADRIWTVLNQREDLGRHPWEPLPDFL